MASGRPGRIPEEGRSPPKIRLFAKPCDSTFGNRPGPSSFSESANEPGGWDRSAIKELWKENLYSGPDGPAISVSVTGPQLLSEEETGTWTASPSGGNGSFNYSWEIQQDTGENWSSICGNTSTCSWTSPPISNTVYSTIRVTVESGLNTATGERSFVVNNDGGGGGGGCDPVAKSLKTDSTDVDRICP